MRSAARYSRPLTLAVIVTGVLSLAASGASLAAPSAPLAHAANNCTLSGHEQQSLGPTYVTALSVSGVSCAQGMKLSRSYYHCRVTHGGVSGHCSGVEGFRCSEVRYAKIATQYLARVSCTRGREIVKLQYEQFT